MEGMELWQQLIATVIAAILIYATTLLKGVKDSKQTKDWSEAIRAWNEPIYLMAAALFENALAKAGDTGHEFVYGDGYDFVKVQLLEFINELSMRTGVKLEFNEAQLDAIIRSAFEEVKRAQPQELRPARE